MEPAGAARPGDGSRQDPPDVSREIWGKRKPHFPAATSTPGRPQGIQQEIPHLQQQGAKGTQQGSGVPPRTVALHCSGRARDGGRRRQQRRRKKRSGRDTLPLCSELPGLPQPGRDTRWCLLPSPGSSEEGCSSTAIRSSLPPGSRQCSACLHGCCWGKLHAGKLSRDGHSWAAHYCTSPGSLRFKHGAVQDPRCSRP